jgi:hypothetical protein
MTDRSQSDNSWSEYSRLVLAQLDTNTGAIKELGTAMHQLRGDLGAQLGTVRLQTVQELATLEQRLGVDARGEVARIRKHFDEEIELVQRDLDLRMGGISATFEDKVKNLNVTMQSFVKELGDKITVLNTTVAGLQVKAGLWGAGGSILGVIAIWLLSQLPKLAGK